MSIEKFYGPGDPFWGWRCIICGEILDPLILENRNLFGKFEGVQKIGSQKERILSKIL
jgi:hypothetical protein